MFRKAARVGAEQLDSFWCECSSRVRFLVYDTQQLKYPLEINNGIRSTQF